MASYADAIPCHRLTSLYLLITTNLHWSSFNLKFSFVFDLSCICAILFKMNLVWCERRIHCGFAAHWWIPVINFCATKRSQRVNFTLMVSWFVPCFVILDPGTTFDWSLWIDGMQGMKEKLDNLKNSRVPAECVLIVDNNRIHYTSPQRT